MPSSPRADTDAAVRDRVRQQEVIANLGRRALETDDLDQLLHDTADAVAETLDTEYAAVLELLPDGDNAMLRQGVGWRDGLVDSETVSADRGSLAGATLRSDEAVVVTDLRTDERVSGSELLTSHDIVSGISVRIGAPENPWGVLGTHTTDEQGFTEHDATFVRSVAKLLESAIESDRSQEERVAIYDRISDGFFALNEDWEFTYLNERAHELINPEGRELVGKNVWNEFSGAMNRAFKPKYERAMYEQETIAFEEYYPAPLDSWFEVRAYPSETGLSVYFRDITERKEREEELELFRTLLDNTYDSVLVIDPPTGRFLDANETACQRLGYDRDELLELTVPDMDHVFADLEEWRSHVEDVKNEGAVTIEGEHERKDGSTYPAEVNVSYIELDREYMVAVARDITERKKQEQRLSTLIANVPGVVYRCKNERGWPMEFVSDACNEVTGYDPEALERGEVSWGDDVMHEDDRERVWETVQQQAAKGEPFSTTYRIETAGGERRWVRSYGRNVFNDERNRVEVEGIISDITERKRLEATLKERRRQLEESNERLEQFAYAASHDLQEPLRMVTSYLQLLERRYDDALDDDGEEFLEFAVDGADRMREMIDGLLEYSRIDTQGDPFEPVELESLVEEVQDDLRMRIDETDARITVGDLPRVNGDESQLRQVFQNLFKNAITYSGDESPRIRVDASRRGDRWVISVHDDGIGIDPEQQDRIFDVFQRLHSQSEHSGTGIGLALCQRIVERHDGELRVDSEPGDGSTFSFTLPAA
ncbi:PAS domain S-box protein [Halopiger xanaduensis]|uniref:histidine kinase n=1 Tax=Halopiger xanaduensis (strain DSM 18323 / JCM 14033 / SH-6) TaxID=797210 RepID=F8DDK5_HALXS|nr:PAS domain S-box protein [Halopiger xanaduensis]AEH39102.1 multi-sensor signal transduction histidine kinase [Halopiger xanaduensis SH-6]